MIGLKKNSEDYKIYNQLKTNSKNKTCSDETQKDKINTYLKSLHKTHWELLEKIQDETGKKIPHICSQYDCNSIEKVRNHTRKYTWFTPPKSLICSNIISKHFKLLLIFKNNYNYFSNTNKNIYKEISNHFSTLLNELNLNGYTDTLKIENSNSKLMEKQQGGKKIKKQTPLQKLKLKHRHQLNKLKDKQKNDVQKLKLKHQSELKKINY